MSAGRGSRRAPLCSQSAAGLVSHFRAAGLFIVRFHAGIKDASKVRRFRPRPAKPRFSFCVPRATLPVALPAALFTVHNVVDFNRHREQTPVQRLARAQVRTQTIERRPERGKALP